MPNNVTNIIKFQGKDEQIKNCWKKSGTTKKV